MPTFGGVHSLDTAFKPKDILTLRTATVFLADRGRSPGPAMRASGWHPFVAGVARMTGRDMALTIAAMAARWLRRVLSPVRLGGPVLAALLAAGPGPAQAQSNVLDTLPVAPDLSRILDSGQLVVAMTCFDNLPFYGTADGQMVGVDIRLAQEIADALGVELMLDRTAESFNDVIVKVARGEADLAISKISRTHRRAMIVGFSDPYVKQRHALMFNRLRLASLSGDADIAEFVRSFDGRIGVIANSSFATFAAEKFPKATVVAFDSWEEVVDATIAGDVDAAYRDEFEVQRVMVDRPDAAINLRTVTITDSVDALAVAVHVDRPRLLAFVNQIIDEQTSDLTVRDLLALYRESSTTDRDD